MRVLSVTENTFGGASCKNCAGEAGERADGAFRGLRGIGAVGLYGFGSILRQGAATDPDQGRWRRGQGWDQCIVWPCPVSGLSGSLTRAGSRKISNGALNFLLSKTGCLTSFPGCLLLKMRIGGLVCRDDPNAFQAILRQRPPSIFSVALAYPPSTKDHSTSGPMSMAGSIRTVRLLRPFSIVSG